MFKKIKEIFTILFKETKLEKRKRLATLVCLGNKHHVESKITFLKESGSKFKVKPSSNDYSNYQRKW